MEGNGQGTKLFQRGERIFGDENGVAGVEVRSDEFLPSGLDDLAGLESLEILMILDGDLEAGVHRLRADFAEHFDGSLHVELEWAGRHAVAVAGEEDPNDGRTHGG